MEVCLGIGGLAVVELRTVDRVVVGLFEPVLDVMVVDVDVLLIAGGTVVDVEDAMDSLLVLVESPSFLDSSPDVLLSIDITELRFLVSGVVVDEVVLVRGFRTDAVNLEGGLFRDVVVVGVDLTVGVSFGLARFDSRVEVTGLVVGFVVTVFLTEAAVLGRCEDVSSPEPV